MAAILTCTSCGEKFGTESATTAVCPRCGSKVISDIHSIETLKRDKPTDGAKAQTDSGVQDLAKRHPVNFGDIKIIREVGRGGMGIVYEGIQQSLNRRVAVKVLTADMSTDPESVARFQREASAAAILSHDNIITVYQIGQQEGVYYYVMPYVEGESLAQVLIRDRKLDANRACAIAIQAALALDYAHSRGVIHRDIKPGNIMLEKGDRVRIADFGLARIITAQSLTQTGSLMGTPAYMSPEQSMGKKVDRTTDIYSLGATLYEAISGKLPFMCDDITLLLAKIRHDPPDPLEDVPRDLETIVLKCMEKEPGRRYKNAKDLAEDLQRFMAGESILARRPGTIERIYMGIKRNRVAFLVGVLFTAVIGSGLWYLLSKSKYFEEVRKEAETKTKESEAGSAERDFESAEILFRERKFNEAADRYSSASKFKIDAFARLAEIAIIQGHPEDARNYISHLPERHPRRLLTEARLALRGGDARRAVELAKSATEIDRSDWEAFDLLARAYEQTQDNEAAREAFREKIRAQREQAGKILQKADATMTGGQATKAESLFREGLDLQMQIGAVSPAHAISYARICAIGGRPESALQYLDAVISSNPSAELRIARAECNVALNKFIDAYEDFDAAAALTSDTAVLGLKIALGTADVGLARKCAEMILTRKSSLSETEVMMCGIAIGKSALAEAKRGSATTITFIDFLTCNIRNPEKAIAQLEKQSDRFSSYVRALLLMSENRLKESLQVLGKPSTEREHALRIGVTQMSEGPEPALELANEALKQHPNSSLLKCARLILLILAERTDEAVRYFGELDMTAMPINEAIVTVQIMSSLFREDSTSTSQNPRFREQMFKIETWYRPRIRLDYDFTRIFSEIQMLEFSPLYGAIAEMNSMLMNLRVYGVSPSSGAAHITKEDAISIVEDFASDITAVRQYARNRAIQVADEIEPILKGLGEDAKFQKKITARDLREVVMAELDRKLRERLYFLLRDPNESNESYNGNRGLTPMYIPELWSVSKQIAATLLTSFQKEQAMQLLRDELTKCADDSEVAGKVMRLSEMLDPAATIRLISSDSETVTCAVVNYLAANLTPEATTAIKALHKSTASAAVRASCTLALACAGDKDVSVSLDEKDPNLWLAVLAKTRLLGEKARPEILKLANHKAPEVRATVAIAIGAIGNPEDIGVLLDLSEDKDARVSRAATCAFYSVPLISAKGWPWNFRYQIRLLTWQNQAPALLLSINDTNRRRFETALIKLAETAEASFTWQVGHFTDEYARKSSPSAEFMAELSGLITQTRRTLTGPENQKYRDRIIQLLNEDLQKHPEKRVPILSSLMALDALVPAKLLEMIKDDDRAIRWLAISRLCENPQPISDDEFAMMIRGEDRVLSASAITIASYWNRTKLDELRKICDTAHQSPTALNLLLKELFRRTRSDKFANLWPDLAAGTGLDVELPGSMRDTRYITPDTVMALVEALKSDSPEVMMLLAYLRAESGQSAKAVEAFRAAAEKYPPDMKRLKFEALKQAAIGLFEMHKNEDAETVVSQAIKLRPGSSEALLIAASIALERKDWNAVIDLTTRALKSNGSNGVAYALRARARKESGDTKAGIKDFTAARKFGASLKEEELALVGEEEVNIDSLVRRLAENKDVYEVRVQLVKALGKKLNETLDAWLSGTNTQQKFAAIVIIRGMNDKEKPEELLPGIIQCIDDSNSILSDEAVGALSGWNYRPLINDEQAKRVIRYVEAQVDKKDLSREFYTIKSAVESYTFAESWKIFFKIVMKLLKGGEQYSLDTALGYFLEKGAQCDESVRAAIVLEAKSVEEKEPGNPAALLLRYYFGGKTFSDRLQALNACSASPQIACESTCAILSDGEWNDAFREAVLKEINSDDQNRSLFGLRVLQFAPALNQTELLALQILAKKSDVPAQVEGCLDAAVWKKGGELGKKNRQDRWRSGESLPFEITTILTTVLEKQVSVGEVARLAIRLSLKEFASNFVELLAQKNLAPQDRYEIANAAAMLGEKSAVKVIDEIAEATLQTEYQYGPPALYYMISDLEMLASITPDEIAPTISKIVERARAQAHKVAALRILHRIQPNSAKKFFDSMMKSEDAALRAALLDSAAADIDLAQSLTESVTIATGSTSDSAAALRKSALRLIAQSGNDKIAQQLAEFLKVQQSYAPDFVDALVRLCTRLDKFEILKSSAGGAPALKPVFARALDEIEDFLLEPAVGMRKATTALELDPTVKRRERLASNLIADSKPDEALALLKQIPDDERSAYGESLIASVYRLKGLKDEAIVHFKAATQKDANEKTYPLALAEAYAESGNQSSSITVLESLVAKEPAYADAWCALGRVRYAVADYEKGLETFLKADELGTTYNARASAGRCLMMMGRFEEAAGQFDAAMAKFKDDDTMLSKSEALLESGDAAGARTIVDKILDSNHNNATAFVLRGKIFAAQGKQDEATADFVKALTVKPNGTTARIELANLKSAHGDVKSAAKLIEESKDDNLGQWYVKLARARLALASKNEKEAVTLLVEAVAAVHPVFAMHILKDAVWNAIRNDPKFPKK